MDLKVTQDNKESKVTEELMALMENQGIKDRKELKEKQDHREHKEQETSASVVIKRNKELRFHLVVLQLLTLKFLRQRLVTKLLHIYLSVVPYFIGNNRANNNTQARIKNDSEGNRQGEASLFSLARCLFLWVRIFTGFRVFRSLCYARGNKNALNSSESRLLGDKIEMRRRLERERSSFFPQIEPRAASEKVKLYSRPNVTQNRNKRLLAVWRAINSTRNRISSLNVFHFLLYRRSSIFQDIYFLYLLRRFVSELIRTRVPVQ